MPAKKRPSGRDPLAGETFIDINAHSRSQPGGPGPQGRPPARRRPPGPPGGSGRRPPRREPPRKGRKPLGKTARRVTLLLAVLTMAAVTALLCVFLLFKVADIQVTGDLVYSQEEVLALCDYAIGDNLLFAPTQSQEERLESQLPYVEDAQVIKHFPNTLEIRITAAQTAASVSSGGGWLYVSSQGKILELAAEPAAATMQVTGFVSTATQPGQYLQAEDATALSALQEILTALTDREMITQCTRLDLTDLYDIRLWYQDRVECKLGSTAELTYKLDFAYDALINPTTENRIGDKETGVLDLSYADTHNAGFLAGPIELEDWTGSAAQTAPEGGGENAGAAQEGEDGRGGDIPNGIFDGDGIVSSTPEESAQDTGETQDTDGTQGTDETWEDPSQETGSGTSEGGDRGGDIPGELFGGEEESSGSAETVDRGGDIPSDIFTG